MEEGKCSSVAVLMSTYNGELYLREQLDSIFRQKYVNVTIYIRDDGSADNTIDILSDYEKCYPGKIYVDRGINVGWKRSFMELVRKTSKLSCKYDYYAFSDQDDIWLPEKLKRATESLSEIKNEIKLYCSNQYYYKDGVNQGCVRTREVMKPTVENSLIRNLAIGCTIVTSPRLMMLMASGEPAGPPPHDFWIYQLAVLMGEAIVDHNSYILYRQHNTNQIGAKKSKFDIWKRRVRKLLFPDIKHEREIQARELLRIYSEFMSEDVRLKVGRVAYYRKSFASRLRLMMNHNYTSGKASNDFWLRLRILFGQL